MERIVRHGKTNSISANGYTRPETPKLSTHEFHQPEPTKSLDLQYSDIGANYIGCGHKTQHAPLRPSNQKAAVANKNKANESYKMRVNPATILIFIACLLGSLYADLGNTAEQASEKYGNPSGKLDSGSKKIYIYETVHGRITEVYDEHGICIESDASKVIPQTLQEPPSEEEPVVEEEPEPEEAEEPLEELDVMEELDEVPEGEPVMWKTPSAPALPAKHTEATAKAPSLKAEAHDSGGPESNQPKRKINVPPAKYVLLFALSVLCILLALVLRVEREEAAKPRFMNERSTLPGTPEHDENPNPGGAQQESHDQNKPRAA